MAISVEEINSLLLERQAAKRPDLEVMRSVRDTYNGDVVIPLPEMDKSEKPAVANLVTVGLDQTAMRIASTQPNLYYPPVREGIKASEDLATSRIRANLGWWQVNRLPLMNRKRARHFVGYASTPVMLLPNTQWGCAEWKMQSPLDTFAAPTSDFGQFVPDDCIFLYTHTLLWLKKRYPDAAAMILKDSRDTKATTLIDIVEYKDGEETVLMAQSRVKIDPYHAYQTQGVPFVELKRIPNRIGVTPVVIPSRITLDKPMGQFDSQLGFYELEAKLTALNVIAVTRGIFPDTYLVGRAGEVPKFIDGPHDGRTGRVNIVSGGIIDVKTTPPSMATDQLADRLERAQRMQGSVPADMTGEAASNVRTGKRGDSIMAATIDFNIQEAQEILAAGAEEENKIAVAIAKSYFGNEKKSFYITSRNFKGDTIYTPNQIFENDNNTVTYSYAGADANSLIVGISQRRGAGQMSAETGMEIDPMISDVEREKDRIQSEQIENAVMQGFTQQVIAGTVPVTDAAKVALYRATGKMSFMEALNKVHEEAQARQAQVAPAGAAETQPGLSMPGMGAEQPSAPQGDQGPGLGSLLEALSSSNGRPNVTMKTKTGVS